MGLKKSALQTISHNCGSGFSDKYQDLWICAKFIRDCLVGHGQPTCSAKSLFYSHPLAGISNLIVLNYPTVWDKWGGKKKEKHYFYLKSHSATQNRHWHRVMFVFYFGFTYLSPLGLSHWASTSWQETSLGKRKQTPLRLPLCVCLCVLVLAHTQTHTDRKKPCGWPVNTPLAGQQTQKMCPRLNLFTPKCTQLRFLPSRI